jgi:AraC-like DNA-binding protein
MIVTEVDIQVTNIIDIRRDVHNGIYIQRPPRNWNTVVFGIENKAVDTIDGKKYYQNEGDLLFFRSGILNRGESAGDKPAVYIFVNFETSDDSVFEKPPLAPVITLSNRAVFEKDFYSILSVWNNREIGYMVHCRELLYRILVNMLRNLEPYKNLRYQHNRIKAAIQLINNRYMENISVTDLAEICNLSVRQMTRHFKMLYNMAPHEYIMDIRFQAAVSLLQNTEISISEIAEHTGYDSVFSFSKAFKLIYGMSPKKFQNR